MPQQFQVLILGVGSIGERHLRCMQNTNRCRVSFCEPNAELQRTISERYGIEHAYPDVDTALEHGGFHVAVIATPSPLHVPLAARLAQHKLHLLIEKPVSTSLDGVEELCNIVESNSLIAAVGYTHRAHPANLAVKAEIASGRFGKPLQAVFHSGQNFPFYRPAYREIYYADRTQGGGGIQDAMTHVCNLGQWLLGPIDRLVTDAAHQALPGVTVEDTVHTLARHRHVLASYALNQFQPANEFRYTIACENGALQVDYQQSRWSWVTEPGGEWQHQTVDVPQRDTLYIRQANALLDSIEGRSEPLCNLEEGVQTLKVNLASLKSVESRSWQEI